MAGSFKNLRKKPKHVRDNVAFSLAGGFTFMLAVAWFFIGFDGLATSPEVSSEGTNGAFSTFIDQIQEQVATAREGVETNEASSTMPTVTGEWGLSAQNASSTNNSVQKEAAIMIVTSSSTRGASSTTASTSVLY